MERAQWIGAVVAVVLAVAGGAWFGRSGPAARPPALVDVGAAVAADEQSLTVHVSGAVRRPGLVEVPPGGRVADAIAAAGGLTPAAAPGGLNLAAPLGDGEQVAVPSVGDGGGDSGGVADDGRVRVNQADAAELESLPGVGPVLAERIAAYRDQHGPFTTVEDLLDVPGIGEAKLAAMRDAVAIP
jgi:competence protein ComEA